MDFSPIGQHGWELIVIFGSFTVGYTAYYVVFNSARITEWFRRKFRNTSAEIWRNLLYRSVLIVFFFAVPAVTLRLVTGKGFADYGIAFHFAWSRLGIIAGLSVLLVVMIVASSFVMEGNW